MAPLNPLVSASSVFLLWKIDSNAVRIFQNCTNVCHGMPLLNREPNPKFLKLYNQNLARFKKGVKGLTAKEQRAVDRKNNWKAKHEELIRNIRAARGESDPEPSYDHRGGSGRGGQGSYGNGGGGGYGGSYGNDYGAQSSYSSKPSNGYGSNKYNSYNNNNYGYDDRNG